MTGPTRAMAVPTRSLVAAHRGGAGLWPENSLTAFRGALELGVDLVELDVHLTADGEVVVIHDPTLRRTTTGRGAVRRRTFAALGAARLRETPDEPVPRLRDVLELVRPTAAGLLVEIKVGRTRRRYPGIEAAVLTRLAVAGLVGRATVMAFEWDTLARLRAHSTAIRLTGLLTRRSALRRGGVAPAARRAAALGATDLGIERTLLSSRTVRAARGAGLSVGVWTVNEPAEILRALALGVDYVTTDRPDLALRLRETA
jgi:glycerophosphoryl diester phosphodiesterase